MIHDQLPTPLQLRAYLTSHGWTEETPKDPQNGMFVFCELSDDGLPITVYVPAAAEIPHFSLRVSDAIDTVAAIEERSKDSVRADMVAASPTPATSPTRPLTIGVADSPTQPLA
ncbi:MAG: hypothetical protein K8U57_29175 [Planctomycetes bacterium]|nr:hypothetical protein [Planctomycetota bacterium]